MSLKIEYPKPLPELVKKNVQLETDFYPTEVVALQNGWRLIKQCLLNHSRQISVSFFGENFIMLGKFRNVETEKFELSALHQHTDQIMNVYGRLIESGLNEVAFINMVLSEVKNIHKLHGVEIDDVKLIISYIKQYLLEFLDKVKSITFQNGLNKLSQLIIDHHTEQNKEEDDD